MKKSLVFMLLLTFVASIAIIGCGPQDEPADASQDENVSESNGNEGEIDKPESLEIWSNDDEYQYAAIEYLVQQFEEETGIEVIVTPYTMHDQDEAFALDGPAGIGPDLIFQPHDRLGNLVTQDLVAPLEVDDTVWSDYTEDAVGAFTLDGNIYGVPLVMETMTLFYNKDLVDEMPATMDELYDLAEELTNRDNDEYGFLFEALGFYHTFPWIGGYGGYIFTQGSDGNYDVDDIGLNTDGTIRAHEEIQSLFDRGILPRTVNAEVVNGLFTEGKVGVVLSGPWSLASYSEALGDSLGVAPMPVLANGEKPTPFAGVKGWLVSNFSDDKYWASQLALHLTTAESQAYYYEETGEIPARPDAEIDNVYAEAFLEQTQTAIPMPNIPEMNQVWDPMDNAQEFNANGDDPHEFLDEAVQEIIDTIGLMQ